MLLRPPLSAVTSFAIALTACPFVSAGQQTYKASIDVVSLTVTVVDKAGKPVHGLTQDDFEVHEDGLTQPVAYFSAGEDESAAPLRIGLLFDTSESMERDISFSRGAAIKFLGTFPKALDFTLVDFDTEVRAARFSHAEFPRLVERIRNRRPKGFTALYDALSVYLGGAFEQSGRKVLVLYTDGGDTSSSRSWSETMRILRASDVTVYPIGFMANQAASARFFQQGKLGEIAALTGGRAFFPAAARDLDPMYEQIGDQIRTQYILGYVSSNPARNGLWRKVNISLKTRRGLTIRAREGYFAPSK